MSTKIPKTFIVSIVTHGNTLLTNGSEPIIIPDLNGTHDIIKINASFHGVEHVTDIETYKKTMKKIIKYVRDNNSKTDLNKKDYVNKFLNILTTCSEDMNSNLLKNKKDLIELDKIQNYLHHTNKSYQLETSKQGIYDKIFWKFDDPIYDELNFNSIHILNFMNLDVMELFQNHFDDDRKHVKLSELIDFLYGFGAEKIIILDLTCSTFVKLVGMEEIDERTTRQVRRNIIKNISKQI